MTRDELQKIIGLSDRKSFMKNYIEPALKQKLIEMTIPDKPNSSKQKYKLTEIGEKLKEKADK